MSAAQQLPSPLPPANPAPIVYCPPERLAAGRSSPYQRLNVFLPPGPAPVGGWPVVVTTGYGGAASVPPLGALASGGATKPFWNLVAAGIAIVHFGTPGVGGNSRGMWFPPGHPSGRAESYLPLHDSAEKSAVWALQWVKTQTQFPFDVERIGLRGSSGGAVLAIRTAMGPERARSSGSPEVRASTHVAAILAIQPPTSAWALVQGPELTIPFPRHLERAAQPGTACAILSQADPELQKDYSLMREAFASAEARANNAAQAICLVYADPVLRIGGAVATLALDATGFPVLHDAILQPLQHDSWFGYVFWRSLIGISAEAQVFHGANSVFAIRNTSALPAPLDHHTRTFRGGVMGPEATPIGHNWLVERLLGGVARVADEGSDEGQGSWRVHAAPQGAEGSGDDNGAGPDQTPLAELLWIASNAQRLELALPDFAGQTVWLRLSNGNPSTRSGSFGLPFGLRPGAGLWVHPHLPSGLFELELAPESRLTHLTLQAFSMDTGRASSPLRIESAR